jgi:hypothetical protein
MVNSPCQAFWKKVGSMGLPPTVRAHTFKEHSYWFLEHMIFVCLYMLKMKLIVLEPTATPVNKIKEDMLLPAYFLINHSQKFLLRMYSVG